MKYLLSLGSNVGDRVKNLRLAEDQLEKSKVKILKESSLYCTNPVDYVTQRDFINLSLLVETDLEPEAFLDRTQGVENEMGRVKLIDKGPRLIDIDIILWEGGEYISERLNVPHAACMERLFVLIPSLEVLEGEVHFAVEREIMERSLKDKGHLFKDQEITRL